MKTTANYTKRISYSKQFLTGALAGLSVRQTLDTTTDAVLLHAESLNRLTKANPGTDCVTGSAFWIYNIGTEEIA
jgi:hypothetical protein